jgi:ribosomal protein S18 acetylase RimI-like enzyme
MIRLARADDREAVCAIDVRLRDIPGRQTFIERAIAAHECYLAMLDDAVAGFVVLDRSFYGQPFVSLLIVDEQHRRRHIGSALMRHVESVCPGEKLFTSTNESNTPMQRLCDKLGYMRSGRIENLDDGDPEIVYFKRVRRTIR